MCSQIRSLNFPGLSLTSRHHGWRAPPGANFFPARPLATIQTGRNRSKIQPCEPWQNGPFSPGAFNYCSKFEVRNYHLGCRLTVVARLASPRFQVRKAQRGFWEKRNLQGLRRNPGQVRKKRLRTSHYARQPRVGFSTGHLIVCAGDTPTC